MLASHLVYLWASQVKACKTEELNKEVWSSEQMGTGWEYVDLRVDVMDLSQKMQRPRKQGAGIS